MRKIFLCIFFICILKKKKLKDFSDIVRIILENETITGRNCFVRTMERRKIMIVQLRLDERLIHGQVVTSWSRALNITTILVANDDIVKDPVKSKVLLMAAPAGKKVHVKSVDETIRLLKDERADKMSILLLVDNPTDALRLVSQLPIQDINIANYQKKKSDDKITIHTYCKADKEDLMIFHELVKTGRHVYAQMLPSMEQEDFNELLQKAEKERNV